jgi:hypothetical protein
MVFQFSLLAPLTCLILAVSVEDAFDLLACTDTIPHTACILVNVELYRCHANMMYYLLILILIESIFSVTLEQLRKHSNYNILSLQPCHSFLPSLFLNVTFSSDALIAPERNSCCNCSNTSSSSPCRTKF